MGSRLRRGNGGDDSGSSPRAIKHHWYGLGDSIAVLGTISLAYCRGERKRNNCVVRPGLIRKRFPIGDIHGARIVQNKWYYGWGIRLTPHGWLFNVSGFDAVELELKNKRKFRIGTDDPQELLMAIQRVSEIASNKEHKYDPT